VPVAEVKVRLVKEPEGPETLALEMLVLMKFPPSCIERIIDETPSTSELDWRVTVGRVSARRISLRKVLLYVGPDW